MKATAPIVTLTLAALATSTPSLASEHRNEISMSGSNGVTSKDPDDFGAISYLRLLGDVFVVGGSFGDGSVLKGRRSIRTTGRAGIRIPEVWAGSNLRPQIQLEYAIPLMMGNDTGYGRYLSVGLIGIAQERIVYGIEILAGKVKQTEVGETEASDSVKSIRLSVGIAF